MAFPSGFETMMVCGMTSTISLSSVSDLLIFSNARVSADLDTIPTAHTRFHGISKNHTDNFACHSSEWETPRLSPIFLFCYYLRTSRSLEITSTVDAKGGILANCA